MRSEDNTVAHLFCPGTRKTMEPIDRRTFAASVAVGIVGTSAQAANARAEVPVGPMVGHVSTTSANVWYRPAEVGKYTLMAHSKEGKVVVRAVGNSADENDRCIVWQIEGLKPATFYIYFFLWYSNKLLFGV
jgi:alkaline phosphatase D